MFLAYQKNKVFLNILTGFNAPAGCTPSGAPRLPLHRGTLRAGRGCDDCNEFL